MLTFIKDIGMLYQTEKSKVKRRFCLVLCSKCKKKHQIQTSQFKAGYTEFCKPCSIKIRNEK